MAIPKPNLKIEDGSRNRGKKAHNVKPPRYAPGEQVKQSVVLQYVGRRPYTANPESPKEHHYEMTCTCRNTFTASQSQLRGSVYVCCKECHSRFRTKAKEDKKAKPFSTPSICWPAIGTLEDQGGAPC